MSLRDCCSRVARHSSSSTSCDITSRGSTAGSSCCARSASASSIVSASSVKRAGLLLIRRPTYSMIRGCPVTMSATPTRRWEATECSSSAAAALTAGGCPPWPLSSESTMVTRLIHSPSLLVVQAATWATHLRRSSDRQSPSRPPPLVSCSRSSFSSCSSASLAESSPGNSSVTTAGMQSTGTAAATALRTRGEGEEARASTRRSRGPNSLGWRPEAEVSQAPRN
mmetsp:Transcript_8834/g.25461  ORF Transcript_8834/g.25461 Transcript_8834/m.25461 type:complete len:225 (-) Transcript_8834:469-1143(-)